ncbi:ribonuclease H-like domain-containing protein [Tanacetum coccineum]
MPTMPTQQQMLHYYHFPLPVSSMSTQQQMPYYYVGPSPTPIQFTTYVPASGVQPTPQAFHTMTFWNQAGIWTREHPQILRTIQTGRLLLRCDSTGDLYPVTQQPSSQTPVVLLSFSSTTWHRQLGHPGDDVLRCLESRNLISCRKSKLSTLCHACQLGSLSSLEAHASELRCVLADSLTAYGSPLEFLGPSCSISGELRCVLADSLTAYGIPVDFTPMITPKCHVYIIGGLTLTVHNGISRKLGPLLTNIQEECPKNLGLGVAKNLKKSSQAPKDVLGELLKKVDYSNDHDNEDEVASVDNDMARSIASEKVGFGTNSLLEQWRDIYEIDDFTMTRTMKICMKSSHFVYLPLRK